MKPDEAQQLALWLARWPMGVNGWVLGMVQLEHTFLKNHGVATLGRILSDKSRLDPVLRLALLRHPRLTDAELEAVRWDVVRHMRTILRDETYMPRDLAASIQEAPRSLAVTLIRGLKANGP